MDLSAIPAVDAHAHGLLVDVVETSEAYRACYTEARQGEEHTLFYRRSLRDVAALLACDATEEAVLAERSRLGAEALAALCLDAANLDVLLVDDGFLPEQTRPLAFLARFVPVRRVLRVESVAERLLRDAAAFDEFRACFRAALEVADVVAFKSIAAYRSGLEVRPVELSEAAVRFEALHGREIRLTDKPLIDFLLGETLEIAARRGIPVQVHTGFGDPDLDLRLANPLHLRGVLEDPRYRAARIVLLHASYPYTREAGWLASVYPQVYLDCGLAVPFLSMAGMREVLRMLLELAPTTKLSYSSDASRIPELYYLAAMRMRRVLGEVLDEAVRDGDLDEAEALEVAEGVLHGNARALYRLPSAQYGGREA